MLEVFHANHGLAGVLRWHEVLLVIRLVRSFLVATDDSVSPGDAGQILQGPIFDEVEILQHWLGDSRYFRVLFRGKYNCQDSLVENVP